MLGVVALGTVAMQSCSKKSDCVCTSADGTSQTYDLSSVPNGLSNSAYCNSLDTSWKITGGNCKLK